MHSISDLVAMPEGLPKPSASYMFLFLSHTFPSAGSTSPQVIGDPHSRRCLQPAPRTGKTGKAGKAKPAASSPKAPGATRPPSQGSVPSDCAAFGREEVTVTPPLHFLPPLGPGVFGFERFARHGSHVSLRHHIFWAFLADPTGGGGPEPQSQAFNLKNRSVVPPGSGSGMITKWHGQ